MNLTHRLGPILCAVTMTLAGFAALQAPVAAAADLTATWDAAYYLPGEKSTLKVTGCPAGAAVTFTFPEGDPISVTVPDQAEPVTQGFVIPVRGSGALSASIGCAPTGQAESTVRAEAYVLGQSLTAVPTRFTLGEPVSLTAGEFVPGAATTLRVRSTDGSVTHWVHPLGTAGEDRTVSAQVTFPTSLACGTYVVQVSSADAATDNSVQATLRLCGPAPSPTPTRSPSPSTTAPGTPTGSSSATPRPRPTQEQGRPTPEQGRPARPGVPATGV